MLLLSVALLPALAAAQEAPDERDPALVFLTVQAILLTDLDHPVHPLLARFDEEMALATLGLDSSRESSMDLRARFAFPSVAAYSAWRSAPETLALFAALRGVPDGFRTSLTLRRVGLARILPTDG